MSQIRIITSRGFEQEAVPEYTANLTISANTNNYDIRAACIAAERHAGNVVVTASVNHVHFSKAVPLGSVLTLEAKVSRSFRTSIEVFIDVWIEPRGSSELREKANEAIYTFVAVDENGKPTAVPLVQPETQLEKARYDAALRRRQLSLILAKKLSPDDATELKALFED